MRTSRLSPLYQRLALQPGLDAIPSPHTRKPTHMQPHAMPNSTNPMPPMTRATSESSLGNKKDKASNNMPQAQHAQPGVARGVPTKPETHIDPPTHQPSPKPFATTHPQSPFEEDLDNNPHSHFLSPVHMYESWDDSDDESDDGSYELDAGITDFALFTDDYNRAKEQNQPLSDKWTDFVASQAECLDRAVARTRAELADRPTAPFYSGSSLSPPHQQQQQQAPPALTPDTSPHLADDLDFDDGAAQQQQQPYQTQIVTPDGPTSFPSSPIDIPGRSKPLSASDSALDSNESDFFDDPSTPAFLLYQHSQRSDRRRRSSSSNLQTLKPQTPVRPGLSAGSRTLSGKLHVWRRPSWGLWSVEEEGEDGECEDEDGGLEMAARGRGREGLRRKRGMVELRGSV